MFLMLILLEVFPLWKRKIAIAEDFASERALYFLSNSLAHIACLEAAFLQKKINLSQIHNLPELALPLPSYAIPLDSHLSSVFLLIFLPLTQILSSRILPGPISDQREKL